MEQLYRIYFRDVYLYLCSLCRRGCRAGRGAAGADRQRQAAYRVPACPRRPRRPGAGMGKIAEKAGALPPFPMWGKGESTGLYFVLYPCGCRLENPYFTSGRLAAAALWPTRRVFSSGASGRKAISGYSSSITLLATSMMMSPPLPLITRPIIWTCLMS